MARLSLSCIRTCSQAGARRERNPDVLAARRRGATVGPTAGGCPAVIPSFTPASGRRAVSAGFAAVRRQSRSMANAAATWCSEARLDVADGDGHAMVGLLGHLETSFARRRHDARLPPCDGTAGCPIGAAPGQAVRGHEFHDLDGRRLARRAPLRCRRCQWHAADGSKRGHVTGSYFHVIDRA